MTIDDGNRSIDASNTPQRNDHFVLRSRRRNRHLPDMPEGPINVLFTDTPVRRVNWEVGHPAFAQNEVPQRGRLRSAFQFLSN